MEIVKKHQRKKTKFMKIRQIRWKEEKFFANTPKKSKMSQNKQNWIDVFEILR